MSDITRILSKIEHGDRKASEELLPLVYDELRKLAAARLANEKAGQTLQPTALVHEAYLRLVDQTNPQKWDGKGHFFVAAAEAMRRILVDAARRKARPKHGGDIRKIPLDSHFAFDDRRRNEVLAVSESLDKLEAESPEKASLVKMRYFAGLTLEEAADALGISRATASRYWGYAKAFLLCELETDESQ